MLFGYARISTIAQNLESQIDLLKTYGVDEKNIFADIDSGSKNDRVELEKMLMRLREGDMVVFHDLSRVGRDLRHLMNVVELFHKQGVDFKDITNPLINTQSTKTAEGELIFLIFGAIAQFFRKSSNKKVKRGLESARSRGRVGGRPKGLSKKLIEKAAVVVKLYTKTDMKIPEIAKTLGMAPNSVYKCLAYEGVKINRNEKRRKINN